MIEVIQSPAPTPAAPATATRDGLREVAQEFEAVFLAQVLANINRGFGLDQEAGLGGDQDLLRDLLNEELAKLISRSGGVGVADAVLKELLKSQEVA